jgi:hypothetical protein
MTAEAVREEFGAPVAKEVGWLDTGPCWTYLHEKRRWLNNVLMFWAIPFVAAICAAEGCDWIDGYVTRKPVLLDFKDEKLVRWDMIEPIVTGRNCTVPLYPKKTWNATLGVWEEDPFPAEECSQVHEALPDPPTCASIRALEFLRVEEN